MDDIPFNEGTKIYQIFVTLSDQEWHCGKHEFPGTQPAKAIQNIRQNGYSVENDTRYCDICQDKTVHRRLTSLQPEQDSYVRIRIPQKLRRRILAYYKNTESITDRNYEPNILEVDHRFPQVRWSKDEDYSFDMPDEEIYQRFQLLTRANNLWKSRYCEKCTVNGERGTFIGINFFYAGERNWDPDIPDDDERGCIGCFWYNPTEWRTALNLLLTNEAVE